MKLLPLFGMRSDLRQHRLAHFIIRFSKNTGLCLFTLVLGGVNPSFAQVSETFGVNRVFEFEQTVDGVIAGSAGIQVVAAFRDPPPLGLLLKIVAPNGDEHQLSAGDSLVYSFTKEYASHEELAANFSAGEYRILSGESAFAFNIAAREQDLEVTELEECERQQDWGKDSWDFRYDAFTPKPPHAFEQIGLDSLDGSRVLASADPDGEWPRVGGSNSASFDVSSVPDGDYEGFILWTPFEALEFNGGATVVLQANSSVLRFPVTLIRQSPSIVRQPVSRYMQEGVPAEVGVRARGGNLDFHLLKWDDRLEEFRVEKVYIGGGGTFVDKPGRYFIRAVNQWGEADSDVFEVWRLERTWLNLLAGIPPISDDLSSASVFAMDISDEGDFYFVEGGRVVRKIDRFGNLHWLAGHPQFSGSIDGQGASARFAYIIDMTVGPDGSIFVADASNNTIRKISPSGAVSTLAGKPGVFAVSDGVGTDASFHWITRVEFDERKNRLLVADAHGSVLRSVTMDGEVSTILGDTLAQTRPGIDGPISTATVGQHSFTSFVLDQEGRIIFVDYQTLRSITVDGHVRTLMSSLEPMDYYSNGLRLVEEPSVGLYSFGDYDVHFLDLTAGSVEHVSAIRGGKLNSVRYHDEQYYGSRDNAIERFDMPARSRIRSSFSDHPEAGRLMNLSVRSQIEPARPLIAGFVLNAPRMRYVVVRGVGPTLGDYGVTDAMSQPRLDLFRSATSLATNSKWSGNDGSNYGAFKLPFGSSDAVISKFLAEGAYTAQLNSKMTSGGVGLVEVYVDPNSEVAHTPVNLSARVTKRAGDPIIAGFVVGGERRRLILIRGIGPSLSDYGVEEVLSDPRIVLYRDGVPMRANEDWDDLNKIGSDDLLPVFSKAGAFALERDSRDAALALELDPGAYTVHLSADSKSATGEVLIEVYVLE